MKTAILPETLEGIPLSFVITQGGGIFLEEPDYSTVTNGEGKTALHYHYGATPGFNKVEVGVLGDPSVTPVELTLEGYLPELAITPESSSVFAPSALSEPINITVTDPRKNLGVKDVEVRLEDITSPPPWKATKFLPTSLMTDINGQGETGAIIPDYEVYIRTLKVYLPEFIDPETGNPVFVELPVKVLYPWWLRIESGNGQIGQANQPLEHPLKVEVWNKWVSTNDGYYLPSTVVFRVKDGEGYLDGVPGQTMVTKETQGSTSAEYLQVTYTFGDKTRLQIIEVEHLTGKEKVYFAAGPAEVETVDAQTFEPLNYLKTASIFNLDWTVGPRGISGTQYLLNLLYLP